MDIEFLALLKQRLASGVASVPSFIGNVATRVTVPDFFGAANVQMRNRRGYITRTGFSNPTMIFPNFLVHGVANASPTYTEVGTGGITTITAALEYPLGTFTQILFSGSATGTIANNSVLTCDPISITIPANTMFWVRTFTTNPSGVPLNLGVSRGANNGTPGGNTNFSDIINIGASGITDNTMGGNYSASTSVNTYGPMAILASTTKPVVMIYGDSLSYGEQDTGDASGDMGMIARSIGGSLNYMNYAIRGDSIFKFLASHTQRLAMLQYASHVFIQAGLNDFVVQGRTTAQVATDTNSMVTLMGGKKSWLGTLNVSATTTDNYATLVNQTTQSWNANRVVENQRRRALAAGFISGFQSTIDVGGVGGGLESSLDSGLISAGHAYYLSTLSTLHPIQAGYLEVQASGILNPNIFTYP